MEQAKLSKWLKAVILAVGICGAAVYLYCVPVWSARMDFLLQNSTAAPLPLLIFIWLTGVPCYAVLVCGWIISSEIGRDNSFCRKNARLLRLVSFLTAGDTLFFFAGSLIFFALGVCRPWVAAVSLLFVCAGAAIAVAAAALSHLVLKAAKLREENDLTI